MSGSPEGQGVSPAAPADVEAVNIADRLALLTDGTVIPITNLIDDDGDDCEADAAVVAIAGQDGLGWWCIELADYQREVAH